jgi:hypothetical protein
MAEAENDNNTEWISLGDYIEREFARVHSVRLADRLTRRYLEERRLKSRYLDADGNPHSGDELPKGFWLEAEISREEHAATRPAKPVPPSILADFMARHRSTENALWVIRTGRPPPPLQPVEPRMCPAIEIYRVEVLVWRVGSTPREELTASELAVSPALTEPAATPIPVEPEAEPTEPKTKHGKTLAVLKGLQAQNKLAPDMKPAAVERLALPPFRKRWPKESDPDRRTTTRAYRVLYPRPPSK